MHILPKNKDEQGKRSSARLPRFESNVKKQQNHKIFSAISGVFILIVYHDFHINVSSEFSAHGFFVFIKMGQAKEKMQLQQQQQHQWLSKMNSAQLQLKQLNAKRKSNESVRHRP